MSAANKIWLSIVTVLVVCLCYSIRKNIDYKTVQSQVKQGIDHPVLDIEHKTDVHGSDHSVVEDKPVSREAAEILNGKLLDSITKLNKLKNPKQLTQYDAYSLHKNGSFTGKVNQPRDSTDTTTKVTLSGKGFSGTEEIHKDGEVTGTYSLKLDLQRANYWKRKWFLGSQHFYEDLWSADTTVHIDTIRNIRIAEAEFSRWSVGAFAGFDFVNKKPAAGVSLNYDIFRFKKRLKK